MILNVFLTHKYNFKSPIYFSKLLVLLIYDSSFRINLLLYCLLHSNNCNFTAIPHSRFYKWNQFYFSRHPPVYNKVAPSGKYFKTNLSKCFTSACVDFNSLPFKLATKSFLVWPNSTIVWISNMLLVLYISSTFGGTDASFTQLFLPSDHKTYYKYHRN